MNLAEGVQSVSLGILGVMMIGTALGVVLFSNIVYSAFLLGGVFISMAGMYLLLNGDFVASAQILIYVGAINVLILFAIMLVNKRQDFSPLPSAGLRKVFTALVSFGLFRHQTSILSGLLFGQFIETLGLLFILVTQELPKEHSTP